MSKRANKKNIMKIVFFVYMIFLFLVVAVKFTGNNMSTVIERWNIISSAKEAGERNLNLKPLTTIRPYLKHFDKSYASTNILANLLLFIPVGFLIPIAYPERKRFFKTMGVCLVITVFIELFQYITCLGFCDIDDIILNMVGSMIGFVVYKCTRKS
ncbi:MAG: VanZ family protein [bacterium]|nr:VanZ family protein [bacterium]